MDGASTETALNRIQAAMDRIERAATRLLSEPSAPVPAPEDNDLQERHDRLRSAVTQTLEQIDALLAGQQP